MRGYRGQVHLESGAPVGGDGSTLRALSAAGLISQKRLGELMELGEMRNRLVRSGGEEILEIDRETVDRLKQARSGIESQLEAS
jgi:hypothetical protein